MTFLPAAASATPPPGGLFRLATGERIHDTQTGLRGYPAAMLPWLLSVRGERYEYELNLLLEAKAAGFGIHSVDIATIYRDHNSGSHFRPLADSVRIYAPLLKFFLSSFAGFLVDTAAFLALSAVTDSVLAAVVGARASSSTGYYILNRRLVFEHGKDTPPAATAGRYVALAVSLLAANYALLSALTGAGVPGWRPNCSPNLGFLASATPSSNASSLPGRRPRRPNRTPPRRPLILLCQPLSRHSLTTA